MAYAVPILGTKQELTWRIINRFLRMAVAMENRLCPIFLIERSHVQPEAFVGGHHF